jgi:DNA polymerase-3 subunit epsilon
LAALLDRARRPIVRLWAVGSPFDLKDVLKARGYRWSDGNGGTPKAWWRDVEEDQLGAELQFLRADIYLNDDVDLPTRRITARERYSGR